MEVQRPENNLDNIFIIVLKNYCILDRNISNKLPNPTSTSIGGTTTNKSQSEEKEGKNQDQSRIK